MKDNSTTATSEAWKMRFPANGTSGAWFYIDDITVTDAWLRVHLGGVGVIPPCRILPRQHPHERYIEELCAALVRMLHMHHMILETIHYKENIIDACCIREMYEAPLQAFNTLARYPHKKDEV